MLQLFPILIVLLISRSANSLCNFGEGCQFECQCKNDAPCDKLTGLCSNNQCKEGTPGDYPWQGYGCLTGNVAFGKPAVPVGGRFGGNAAAAVDGNTNSDIRRGDYSQCAAPYDDPPRGVRWSLDLEDLYRITQVTIYNVNDKTEYTKIQGTEILVTNSSDIDDTSRIWCDTIETIPQGRNKTFECATPLIGSKVILYHEQILNQFVVCEVVVTGHRYINCFGCENQCDPEYGCISNCPAGKNRSTLCHEDCTSGYYGENCQYECGHCVDGGTCDKTSGVCPSTCQQWWASDQCNQQIAPVGFTSEQTVTKDITNSSFTVEWYAIRGISVGLAEHYVYQIHPFIVVDIPHKEGKMSQVITGLKHNHRYNYNIKVYRKDRGETELIQGSLTGSAKTLCVAPAAPAPPRLTTESLSEENQTCTIRVDWQLSKDDIGCDEIKSINIKIQAEDRSEEHIQMICDAKAPPCITNDVKLGNYTVSMYLVNNADLPSPTVTESISIRSTEEEDKEPEDEGTGSISRAQIAIAVVGSCAGVLLITVGIIVFMTRRKAQKNGAKPVPSYQNVAFIPPDLNGQQNQRITIVERDEPVSVIVEEPVEADEVYEDTDTSISPFSDIIPKDQFEQHFEDWKTRMKERYQKIPKEGLSSVDTARKACNMPRNRYKNITPYDHTRVVLSPLENDPDSDYINANLIKGYPDMKDMYIAAQGPLPYTVRDFWRMIVEYHVTKIVMLTCCCENAKQLCEQYWPSEIGHRQIYDTAVVKMQSEEKTAHYTIRTLAVTYKGEQLVVQHYQMTSWRDKSKPESPLPMLDLITRVRATRGQDTVPLVVHCSAGAGRTGTYIALDCLLDQLHTEGMIDVDGQVHKLRTQRPWLVQTLNQFVFIHEFLVYYLKIGDMAINTTSLLHQPELYESMAEEQFEAVNKLSNTKPNTLQGLLADNSHKNRNSHIVPDDKYRPYLCLPAPNSNDYINAVYVDSFWHMNSLLVTQVPLEHTVVDFWRLVHDHDITLIVLLENLPPINNVFQHWPEKEESCRVYGPLQVKFVSKTVDKKCDKIIIWELKISQHQRQNYSIGVTLYQFVGWPGDVTLPEPGDFLHLLDTLNPLLSSGKKTIIQCLDGAHHSGLFCAGSHVVAQSAIWEQVDIATAVLGCRERRPQIINSQDQYRFLYKLIEHSLQEVSVEHSLPAAHPEEPIYVNTDLSQQNIYANTE